MSKSSSASSVIAIFGPRLAMLGCKNPSARGARAFLTTGAWGPAIFSDDLATDIRADYTDLIGQGISSAEATQRLVREYRPHADSDDGPVFWLALAATQRRLGRLEEVVKHRALQVIDDGTNLRRWERDTSAGQARKRQSALQRLKFKQQLLTDPPHRSACRNGTWKRENLLSVTW